LESDKHTTIGSMLWLHHRLVSFLKKASTTTAYDPTIIKFCERAIDSFELKFSSNVDRPAMIGALLDPRHKKLTYLSKSESDKCQDALRAAYDILLMGLGREQEVLQVQPSKKSKVNHPSVLSDFTSDILDTVSPTKAVPKTELEKYLMLEEEERDTDPLEWWRLNRRRYPTLAVLARRYLAIPASSASSERLFSRLKLTACCLFPTIRKSLVLGGIEVEGVLIEVYTAKKNTKSLRLRSNLCFHG
jgi:hypothetical protein